jgi:hypothetical protein
MRHLCDLSCSHSMILIDDVYLLFGDHGTNRRRCGFYWRAGGVGREGVSQKERSRRRFRCDSVERPMWTVIRDRPPRPSLTYIFSPRVSRRRLSAARLWGRATMNRSSSTSNSKRPGYSPSGLDKKPTFAQVAEALGEKGIRLGEPGDFREGLAAALAHDGGPVVVDAVVDPSALSLPSHVPAHCQRLHS